MHSEHSKIKQTITITTTVLVQGVLQVIVLSTNHLFSIPTDIGKKQRTHNQSL